MPPPTPPTLSSGYFYIKDTQSVAKNVITYLGFFSIVSFCVIGAQKDKKDAQKKSSKIAKFTGTIRIDLRIIFRKMIFS